MYVEDLSLLCCPRSCEPLELVDVSARDADGEVLEGRLVGASTGGSYPIRNGIPRFNEEPSYNASWDYKWTVIDAAKGLNYRIVDRADKAYLIHDLFDRNRHGGRAYEHARGRVALDIGCGVGQYSYRLAEEFAPAKMVSMDLTRGVDVFRKILLERFPHLKRRVQMVQASVFDMPFRDETFDYVLSLGVLMHTGRTLSAIGQAARVLKYGGQINLWIYAAMVVHNGQNEAERGRVLDYYNCLPRLVYQIKNQVQISLFRLLPHGISTAIVRAFSSDLWYRICRLPVIRYLAMFLFGTTLHPDRDYRFINNYDGWINSWSTNWGESEIFPALRNASIVIKGFSDWRIGIWGVKHRGFYD